MNEYAPVDAAPTAPPEAAPAAPAQQQSFGLRSPEQAQNFFSDPQAMYRMAQLAAQHRQPDTMKWLAMGARAVQENAIEATQHLLAGDGEAAVKAFNKSGRFNDAQAAARNDDGTWTLTRKGGGKITINPETVMKSFLSPKDFAAQAQDEARTRIQQQQADTQARQVDNQQRYQEGMLDHYKRADESQSALRDAQAQQARERWAHEIEKLGIRNEAAVALANARREVAGDKSAMNDRYAPMAFRQKLIEEAMKQGAGEDPAKLTAAVDFTVRDTFTQIYPRRDGKGFDVVTTVGGEPVVLGNFPDMAAATEAKGAFVTGKAPAAPKTAKPPKPAKPVPKPPARELPGFNLTANDVWGPDPAAERRKRMLERTIPGSKYVDVGAY